MAIRIYISGNFLIAKDDVTNKLIFKSDKQSSMHYRDENDVYFFFLNNPTQFSIDSVLTSKMLGSQGYQFSDIRDGLGVVYPNSNSLDTNFNDNLGVYCHSSGGHQYMKILLVIDSGNSNKIIQQVNEYDETTSSWSIAYRDVDGNSYIPTGPLEYKGAYNPTPVILSSNIQNLKTNIVNSLILDGSFLDAISSISISGSVSGLLVFNVVSNTESQLKIDITTLSVDEIVTITMDYPINGTLTFDINVSLAFIPGSALYPWVRKLGMDALTEAPGTILPDVGDGWGMHGASADIIIPAFIDFKVSWNFKEAGGFAMFGVSFTDPNVHYQTIDYAVYSLSTQSYQCWESGLSKFSQNTPAPITSVFSIERINEQIIYKIDGTVFYTSLVPNNTTMLIDLSCRVLKGVENVEITY